MKGVVLIGPLSTREPDLVTRRMSTGKRDLSRSKKAMSMVQTTTQTVALGQATVMEIKTVLPIQTVVMPATQKEKTPMQFHLT